jgi:hypothetical protein
MIMISPDWSRHLSHLKRTLVLSTADPAKRAAFLERCAIAGSPDNLSQKDRRIYYLAVLMLKSE